MKDIWLALGLVSGVASAMFWVVSARVRSIALARYLHVTAKWNARAAYASALTITFQLLATYWPTSLPQ
ncbi:hypothetical protein J3P96_11935 [Pseudomonas sp. R3-56]|uniref:hypothetical protein n=1 Tax=Pseudomonas sp. R3-56 TaxID=2817401 RepID=UPI003DAA3DE5